MKLFGSLQPIAFLCLLPSLTTTLQGCMPSIWNAGDVAQWVQQQAIEQGCQNDSIELEEWYRETEIGNVWYGNCIDDSGEAKTLAITVDSVWSPSEA